ncbi:hypothetical protein E6C76_20225 [Pseudothauera nasutitermitis]|uniref:Terminase small subunit n=1 Tax=Pseudothauera nasutitermitis TaxID=2565930 RepID=A0A4S4AP35_9RHOO|nr:hypothetical protein [Pseudothauera nasutitermitis]THF61411.1 hypothetical protein E6C76_20225 [Pseudothauera nasutitermitis]
MTHPETTFKAFAEIIGCRPSYVTELRKSGRLVLTDDGRAVRVAESIARIEATRDPSRAGVAERHAAQRGAPLATVGDDAPGGDVPEEPDTEGNPDYQLWKARRERAAALREEMRLAEEAKEYLRRGDAAAVVAEAFVMLRAGLEALPDNLAPVVAGENDEGRVRVLLAEEIESILGNCAAELRKLGQGEG